jgi:HK97 family phage portal protein
VAFVVSAGVLRALDQPVPPAPFALRLSGGRVEEYAELWRTQPAVRTVVEFLARNIASLGLHVFRRVSDTDRERLTDHPLARLIVRPNPVTTRYRLLHALVSDLAIFDVAFWAKLGTPEVSGVVRLPPERVVPDGENWLAPEAFVVHGSRGRVRLPADHVVHFRGYHPRDQRVGCSGLEALRRILAEEFEAGRMREQVLRNGARISGYLERPAEAPKWSSGAKERFRADWHAQYAGEGPQAGGTPILEDGMVFHAAAQTAEQLQYVEARKLTREEVAAAYFIPPPMLGMLDRPTFSNITEQHKMLYQDTLGPWLSMICEEIQLQLLADLAESDDVYCEFQLASKLDGSFEEQAQHLQTAVGAPWLTRNEARARMNLPAIEYGDELVAPLNVLIGGQASPTDTAQAGNGGSGLAACRPMVKARAPQADEDRYVRALRAFFARQGDAVRGVLGGKADTGWWDGVRWDAELYRLSLQVSRTVARSVLDDLGLEPDIYDVERTLAFLAAAAERSATGINATTKAQLDDALASNDPEAELARVFENAGGARAVQIATTIVTAISGFATVEAAKQVAGDTAVKSWWAGKNPRPAHAALNGQTVRVSEPFSTGQMWPGDPTGDASDTAGCNCHVSVAVG